MSFRERYEELSSKLGACPIEVGEIGNLADNECEHGRLAGDRTPACGCFARRPVAVQRGDAAELATGVASLNEAQELALDDLLERQAA